MMKKIAGIIAICVATWLVSGGVTFAQKAADRPTLRILNCSQYIDVDEALPAELPIEQRSPTLREFMEQENCHIEYVELDNDAALIGRFIDLDGFYDLVMIPCEFSKSMLDFNGAMQIDAELIPNLRHLDSALSDASPDPHYKYLIPYQSGYTGLAFRKDLIGRDTLTWADYFNPPADWKGRIGAYNSAVTMFLGALITDGQECATAASKDFEKAQIALERLVNPWKAFISDDPDELRRKLLAGEIVVTPLYSCDAKAVLSESVHTAFVLPPEGSEFYRDYFAIHRNSQQALLAHKFINFLLEPQILGRIAAYFGSEAPSKEARAVSEGISRPVVPPGTDEAGRPVQGMQITYSLDPEIEARWIEIIGVSSKASAYP